MLDENNADIPQPGADRRVSDADTGDAAAAGPAGITLRTPAGLCNAGEPATDTPPTAPVRNATPSPVSTQSEDPAPGADPRIATRQADSFGVVPAPVSARDASDADATDFRRLFEQRQQALEDDDHEIEEITSARESRSLGSTLFNTTFVLAVVALVALFVLFAFTQLILAIASLRSLTAGIPWLGVIGVGALLLLCTLVLAFFVRVAWLFWRLRETPSLTMPARDILNERASLRRQRARARQRLVDFMKQYPTNALAELGFDKSQRTNLLSRFEDLSSGRLHNDQDWLEEFSTSFVETLDQLARSRIKRTAKQVALATATTPIGIVDSMIVLIQWFRLTGQLCTIYNARPGRLGIAVILARAFTHAYIASEIEEAARDALNAAIQRASDSDARVAATDTAAEATQATTESAGTAAADGLSDVEWMVDGAASLCTGVAKALAPKAAEAAANYFMIARLGNSTMRLLRPIR